jgi:uncharacterized cysteine cluster protein YcgN (CxxCxxCC family)
MTPPPFWKTKSLAQMTPQEWESLCDGCGICCLEKLQDVDSGWVGFTAVACRYLDTDSCRCRIYTERHRRNPNCISITAENVADLTWLPESCAYRRLAEGKQLMSWHPLVSKDDESVHNCGISVRGRVISARYVHLQDLEAYRVDTQKDENMDRPDRPVPEPTSGSSGNMDD